MPNEYDTSHRQWWNPPGKVYWKSEWKTFLAILVNAIVVLLLDVFFIGEKGLPPVKMYPVYILIGWGLAIVEELIVDRIKAKKKHVEP